MGLGLFPFLHPLKKDQAEGFLGLFETLKKKDQVEPFSSVSQRIKKGAGGMRHLKFPTLKKGIP